MSLDASGSAEQNRAYYDAFSRRYERHRGAADPGGYHELVDELEAEFVRRYGENREVLEVGCGTGLVLSRIARFASRAEGIDLSPGMLEHARARGLSCRLGSATDLPWPDGSFDVACAFKVLAHVPELSRALEEMARVVRPGGVVVAEYYNPWSLRGLLRRLGPAGEVASGTREHHVYTRFDPPWRARRLAPPGTRLIATRGVRVATPTAHLFRVPGLRSALRAVERGLADGPLRHLGGFYLAAYRKLG